MPQYYSASRQYTPDQYADALIQQYSTQLKILYNYGAQEVCADWSGSDRLQSQSLVAQFNGNTPDARFIYINAYGIFQDIINRPAAFGFTVTNAGMLRRWEE
ncbi:hypothetical protein OIU78_000480 [Salix suchowensis]|nr:hypothetical protein OIU78_000480 [Salix suchowensis]